MYGSVTHVIGSSWLLVLLVLSLSYFLKAHSRYLYFLEFLFTLLLHMLWYSCCSDKKVPLTTDKQIWPTSTSWKVGICLYWYLNLSKWLFILLLVPIFFRCSVLSALFSSLWRASDPGSCHSFCVIGSVLLFLFPSWCLLLPPLSGPQHWTIDCRICVVNSGRGDLCNASFSWCCWSFAIASWFSIFLPPTFLSPLTAAPASGLVPVVTRWCLHLVSLGFPFLALLSLVPAPAPVIAFLVPFHACSSPSVQP